MPGRNNAHLLLYSTNKKDDELLISILKQSELRFEVTNSKPQLLTKLKDGINKLILISTPSLVNSVRFYYECLLDIPDEELCRHALVVTCSRQEERQAFNYYQSRVVDDYLLTRPLYELHRPISVCYAQLERLGVNLHKSILTTELNGDSSTVAHNSLIREGAERKLKLRGEFETLVAEFDKAIEQADEHLNKQEISAEDVKRLQGLLKRLHQSSFRPSLIRLQHKTLNLLDALLDKLAQPDEPADIETNNAPEIQQLSAQTIRDEAQVCRILLVEDDNVSAMMSRRLIEGMGLSFDWASSGRRALALLQAKPFDLILMDINLPDTNGLLIADQLPHMNCINSSTVVAILTGIKQKHMVQRAAKVGAKHYLIKPLQQEILVKVCSRYDLKIPDEPP